MSGPTYKYKLPLFPHWIIMRNLLYVHVNRFERANITDKTKTTILGLPRPPPAADEDVFY